MAQARAVAWHTPNAPQARSLGAGSARAAGYLSLAPERWLPLARAVGEELGVVSVPAAVGQRLASDLACREQPNSRAVVMTYFDWLRTVPGPRAISRMGLGLPG